MSENLGNFGDYGIGIRVEMDSFKTALKEVVDTLKESNNIMLSTLGKLETKVSSTGNSFKKATTSMADSSDATAKRIVNSFGLVDKSVSELSNFITELTRDNQNFKKIAQDSSITVSQAKKIVKDYYKEKADAAKMAIKEQEASARSQYELLKQQHLDTEIARKSGSQLTAKVNYGSFGSGFADYISNDYKKGINEATGYLKELETKSKAITRETAQQSELEIKKAVAAINQDLRMLNAEPVKKTNFAFTALKGTITALVTTLKYMASYAVIGAFTDLTAGSIKFAGSVEMIKEQFKVLTGSIGDAKRLYSQIQDYAIVSPFRIPEISEASKKLLAVGFATDTIIPKLKMIGDVSMGNEDKFNRLTNAYERVASRGRASMRELNMFIYAGVPIIQELAKNMGVAESKIYDMSRKGQIGYSDIDKALQTLTGDQGRFHNMVTTQSTTLIGKMAILEDSYHIMAANLTSLLLPAMKKTIDMLIGLTNNVYHFTNSLSFWIDTNPKAIQTIKDTTVAVGLLAGSIWLASTGAIPAIIESIALMGLKFKAAGQVIVAMTEANCIPALIEGFKDLIAIFTTMDIAAALTNPIGLAIVAIGGIAAAIYLWNSRNKEVVASIDQVNNRTNKQIDHTRSLLSEIGVLHEKEHKTLKDKEDLKNKIEELCKQYPKYASKLREELELKGKISDATAKEIANEITLAKVKELNIEKAKIDKRASIEKGLSNSIFGTTYVDRKSGKTYRSFTPSFSKQDKEAVGNWGVTKGTQDAQNKINKALKDTKNQSDSIYNSLKKLDVGSNYSRKIEDSAGDSTKHKKQSIGSPKTSYTVAAPMAESAAKEKFTSDLWGEMSDSDRDKIVREYQTHLNTLARLEHSKFKNKNELIRAENLRFTAQLNHDLLLMQKKYSIDKTIADYKINLESLKKQSEMQKEEARHQNAMMGGLDPVEEAKQKLAADKYLYEQEKALGDKTLKQLEKTNATNTQKYKDFKKDLEKIDIDYNETKKKNEDALEEAQAQKLIDLKQKVNSNLESTIGDILKGTKSASDSIKGIFVGIYDAFADMVAKMLAKKLTLALFDTNAGKAVSKKFGVDTGTSTGGASPIGNAATIAEGTSKVIQLKEALSGANSSASTLGETVKTAATATSTIGVASQSSTAGLSLFNASLLKSTAQTALLAVELPVIAASLIATSIAAPLSAIGLLAASASMAITGIAAKFAAGGVADLAVALAAESAASVPVIGWANAPSAAMATGQAIAAASKLPSFDVGTMSVPQDMIAQIHKNEMIVPATFADGVRQLISNGGENKNLQPPSISYTINTVSSKGFKEILMQHSDTIAQANAKAKRYNKG